jgi:hypothetical protein
VGLEKFIQEKGTGLFSDADEFMRKGIPTDQLRLIRDACSGVN